MDRTAFRDMCAAMAMQGMIAGKEGDARGVAAIVEQAFTVAEAMASERARRDVKRDMYGRVVSE